MHHIAQSGLQGPAQLQIWPHSVDALTFHGQAFSHRQVALSTLSFPRCQLTVGSGVGPVGCVESAGPQRTRPHHGRSQQDAGVGGNHRLGLH